MAGASDRRPHAGEPRAGELRKSVSWLRRRFLAIFAVASVIGLGASVFVVDPYLLLVGTLTSGVVSALGTAAELLRVEGSFEQGVIWLSLAGSPTPLALFIALPTLTPVLFTALLIATPGVGWRALVARLLLGQGILGVLRAASLVGHWGVESAGFAGTTETIELAEAVVIGLAAADRAAPLLVWALLSPREIAALVRLGSWTSANR